MKQLTIRLGLILLFCACGLQVFAQQAARQDLTAASNGSPSATSSSPASTQDQKPVASDNGFDKPPHRTHVRLGGIMVGGGYAHSSGFYPYPFAYGPFYDPFYYPFCAALLWNPFWGYYPPFYPAGYFDSGAGKGELKLTGAPKDASVYVNGGYAGTMANLKSFWLEPGAYDLAVTTADGRRFQQRVYMLTGKTLKVDAKPLERPKQGENL